MVTTSRARQLIDTSGALLLYPIDNRGDPPSLWHALYPKSAMRWAWDDSADERVVELWHLRAELARSRKVVYTKWLGGRATFFSKPLFESMLRTLRFEHDLERQLSASSRALLEALRDDSPQPTGALRATTMLEGRENETELNRAMRALWSRLLIVGAGEAEEGGYPSLTVGATELLFEDLWVATEDAPTARDRDRIASFLERSQAFRRTWRRLTGSLPARESADISDSEIAQP